MSRQSSPSQYVPRLLVVGGDRHRGELQRALRCLGWEARGRDILFTKERGLADFPTLGGKGIYAWRGAQTLNCTLHNGDGGVGVGLRLPTPLLVRPAEDGPAACRPLHDVGYLVWTIVCAGDGEHGAWAVADDDDLAAGGDDGFV